MTINNAIDSGGIGVYLPSNIGQTLLNYYEEFSSTGNTWTGPFAVPQAGEYKIIKIGKIVILKLPTISSASNNANHIVNSVNIPARFLLSTTISYPFIVQSTAATFINASIQVNNAGVISIWHSITTGNFAAVGTVGFLQSTISWNLN